MKLYELVIEDESTDEVFAISLVENPAIESNWIAFDKEAIQFASVDTEKKMIIGPILIPNKHILRVDGEGQPYHVTFSRDTVARLAQNYLMKKYTDSATLEHDKKIKGVHLVESWIKDGKLDKSNNYGLNVPEGTWMGIMKITDDKLWKDYIKTGKILGFSIEGYFEHRLIHASLIETKEVNDLTEEEAKIVLSQIKAIIKKDNRFKKKERIVFESYSDYPQSVRDAARIAREQNEKIGNKCMTLIGKRRAADLEEGRPVSRETIARMVSYLSRAKDVYEQNKSDRESCSYIAYKGWGGETALIWAENKLKQLNLSQPSVSSSYPGEVASGSVAPALLVEEQLVCPEATQNIAVNLKNRQNCIDVADYGPLNPNEPNEDYWKKKADMFKGDVETAKKSLCGNCAFFVQTQKMLDCIAEGIGGEVKDEWDTIEAGDLGYCEAFDFKCAASRTCNAWVVGGPIID